MTTEKVYCKGCECLRGKCSLSFSARCKHPHNWKPTWYKPERRPPWEINKDNNCKWFTKKRPWAIVRRCFGID